MTKIPAAISPTATRPTSETKASFARAQLADEVASRFVARSRRAVDEERDDEDGRTDRAARQERACAHWTRAVGEEGFEPSRSFEQ